MWMCKYVSANLLLELGKEDSAVQIFLDLMDKNVSYQNPKVLRDLGIAYLRLGERANCISNHAAESCILPIKGIGIHQDIEGSRRAIIIYERLLKSNSIDLESRWLLNIAYMTLGEYPHNVPTEYLIANMQGDTAVKVNSFVDIAADLKIDTKNMAGGSITEDFNNDGYLDIFTSSWDLDEPVHYMKNNGDGTFTDVTQTAGVSEITGGLNIMQTDYNNDGFKDVFILRGAWKGTFGREPNSLLRNNGDGTFTDVTAESGLLSFHPTQTATWNDFNNDGWLDVFIGNESRLRPELDLHPCELYINNQDGTFSDVAVQANCNIKLFVKGVTSGDYDNDGWKDLFLSTMSGKRVLLKNKGTRDVAFEDVTIQAGIGNIGENTFPTWFWDYDNDGWLDIYTCDYSFQTSLGFYAAAEKLGIAAGASDKMLLYHNNHDGTFTNVARESGLNKVAFAMGANFGDIDNDGYLDFYLGTGNPSYQSLVPNMMFKNLGGKQFADVTATARVGHLQKGHGVSFADLDNDGDQDVHIDMGGAFLGDAYQNSFFLNPGQGDNHWINITLEGKRANRSAIGSRVRIVISENGVKREIYRDVNSGGSFGSSPLRREIGLGVAAHIELMEIKWHGSEVVQVFKDVKVDQFIKITEGNDTIEQVKLKAIDWNLPNKLCVPIAMVR
jgi:hypothetical protein